MKETISIVVPCFNEEETIKIFFKETQSVLRGKLPDFNLEYLFIDDGSKDNTLNVLKDLSNNNLEIVSYLSFSKNFGKEAALYAGLKEATGNYIIVMDVDMQDPPSLIPEMIASIRLEGYDSVATRRIDRKGEPPIRSWFARQFYRLINRIADIEIVDGARDFRVMTRQMVEAILSVSEYNRFSKGIFSWVGFDTKYIEYKNIERAAGQSNWSFWSLLKYSVDGIVAFSEIPLSLASFVGMISFIISIVLAAFFSIRTLIFNNPTSGWTSLMVIILALGGLQLLSLGILGKYLSKTFLEVKRRPLYIIKEKNKKE